MFNFMGSAVKAEKLNWSNLDLSGKHGHLLDIPTLGVLQNELSSYFISRDPTHLYNCLVQVKENPRDFTLAKASVFKWGGEDTSKFCSDRGLGKVHFKLVNLFGLEVLTQACLFEACYPYSMDNNNTSMVPFLHEMKQNNIIYQEFCDYTQNIKGNLVEVDKEIHKGIPKNL